MRGFGSICGILVALLWACGARADDRSLVHASFVAPPPATQIGNLGSSGDRIRGVVSGLRQSLTDNGFSQVLTRASDWVKELEVSWTAHRNGHAGGKIDTEADSDLATDAATAAVTDKRIVFAAHPASLNLGLISFGTNDTEDQVWTLGHAQPLTSRTVGADHDGSTTGERSLASHNIELALRMPIFPWNATVAGARYWWGVRGFGPQVEGTRVALKFSPMQNVEIEGGRASDTRGNGGFVGLRYSTPLDQPK